MTVSPDAESINRLIDEALEEIERTELEMLDLLSDVLGPDEAQRVADQIIAQEGAERFRRLLDAGDRKSARRNEGNEAGRAAPKKE